jgi:hypothetical protein
LRESSPGKSRNAAKPGLYKSESHKSKRLNNGVKIAVVADEEPGGPQQGDGDLSGIGERGTICGANGAGSSEFL